MNNTLLRQAEHILIKASFLLVISLALTNCTSNKSTDLKMIEDALQKANTSIENAVSNKNLDSLMSLYAEDACLLPTAEPIVKGKASIRKEWEHIFEIPDFNNKSTLTEIVISKDGDMAYSMGYYIATMMGEDGNAVQEPGKWVTIWKKQSDGQWRIAIDIYNTDIPPPDHK